MEYAIPVRLGQYQNESLLSEEVYLNVKISDHFLYMSRFWPNNKSRMYLLENTGKNAHVDA